MTIKEKIIDDIIGFVPPHKTFNIMPHFYSFKSFKYYWRVDVMKKASIAELVYMLSIVKNNK